LQGEEGAIGRVSNPAVSLKRRSDEKQNERNCGGEEREVVGVDADRHAKGTRGFVTRLPETALENSRVDGSDWDKKERRHASVRSHKRGQQNDRLQIQRKEGGRGGGHQEVGRETKALRRLERRLHS
jgi:hypothetical protein